MKCKECMTYIMKYDHLVRMWRDIIPEIAKIMGKNTQDEELSKIAYDTTIQIEKEIRYLIVNFSEKRCSMTNRCRFMPR